MTASAREQVPRMLAMVPYLRAHEGIPVDQVAADFGVSRSQIVKDLNVLWFCGLPEAVTGDMIDIDMDALEREGVVRVDNTDFLPRPLRLSTAEALSLIVALRTLRDSATTAELPTIESALVKLESAAGDGAAASAAVQVHIERADPAVHAAAREALSSGRRLHLTYLVPARDEQTERDVDPLRLLTEEGRPYLEAWCLRAEGVRLFRLDRVTRAQMLDTAADPHDAVARRDLSEGLFTPGENDLEAVLDVEGPSRWIAEHHPVDAQSEQPDGTLRVWLRVADPGWLRRLVLRQAGAVRIVSPAWLSDEVEESARAALQAYGVH
ncbi:MAG: WYL domain-containing protein [Actinomycetota bacterium]|nr:WYL domain-containing protein [Actinomycetota bacterium]